MLSGNISTSPLRRAISNKAVDQFKLRTFFYAQGEHQTLATGDHTFAFPIMDRTVFTPADAVLQEGVTPAARKVGWHAVDVAMTQYGVMVELSDVLLKDNPFPILEKSGTELGRQMAEVVDTVIQDKLLALDNTNQTQVTYGTNRATRALIQSTDYLTADQIAAAAAILGAKGTPTIGGDYVAVLSPIQQYALFTETTAGAFIQVSKYTNPDLYFNGEIGKIFGCRFVISPNIRSFKGGVNGTVDIYPTYIIGEEAYGVVESQAMETYVKPLGSAGSADPLNQRATVGLKIRYGIEVLKPEANFRIESASKLSPTLPY